jgi:hypothetical protein
VVLGQRPKSKEIGLGSYSPPLVSLFGPSPTHVLKNEMHVLLWNVFDTFLNNVASILVMCTSILYKSIKHLCKSHLLIKITNFYRLQENAKDRKHTISIHQLSE